MVWQAMVIVGGVIIIPIAIAMFLGRKQKSETPRTEK